MDNNKFSSYALTVRPLNGIDDGQISRLSKWIVKNSKYYRLITEKSGSERHAHVGFILKEPKTRSNVLQRVLQLFTELSTTERQVLRKGLKIMYNTDFVTKYLDKDDETVVIVDNLPEVSRLDSFFPPKPAPKSNSVKKCSLYYHELESLWNLHVPVGTDVNTKTCRNFLFNVMYNLRVLPIIRDDRAIIQTARHLTRWLKRTEDSTIQIPPFESEE